MSDTTARQPTLFIPHGGGPCFFMDPPPSAPHLWDRMADYLRSIAASLPQRPRALLVISGHWEAPRPTVNTAAHPTLLFDYYGFPEHTYRLTYPVAGAPDLAAEVRRLLAAAGIATAADGARGLDHGVFIPLKVAFPDADIPVLQLSLQQGLDPAAHLAIGRALAPLRDQGVLIVGSGMSYHNLRLLFSGRGDAEAQAFDDWLVAAATAPDPSAARRPAARVGNRTVRARLPPGGGAPDPADGRGRGGRRGCRPPCLWRATGRQGAVGVPVRLIAALRPQPRRDRRQLVEIPRDRVRTLGHRRRAIAPGGEDRRGSPAPRAATMSLRWSPAMTACAASPPARGQGGAAGAPGRACGPENCRRRRSRRSAAPGRSRPARRAPAPPACWCRRRPASRPRAAGPASPPRRDRGGVASARWAP